MVCGSWSFFYLGWTEFLFVLFFCWLIQNFLFKSQDEDAPLKAVDFGLSDFIKPGIAFSSRGACVFETLVFGSVSICTKVLMWKLSTYSNSLKVGKAYTIRPRSTIYEKIQFKE